MVSLLVSLLAALSGTTPGSPIMAEPSTHVPGCPAPTPNGRRLATAYASSDLYTSARERRGFPRVSAEEIRPLTDSEACKRLREFLEARARAAGGTSSGSRPEFYEVGEYYYAVIPAEASRCTPRPGYLCVDTRWQSLIVFDQSFKLVAAVAI